MNQYTDTKHRQRMHSKSLHTYSVADTRVLDVDENLIWAGLLHGNLLVLDGTTSLFNDTSPLFRGKVLGLSLSWLAESSK